MHGIENDSQLLGCAFPQLTKKGNGKAGMDAGSPVDVGEEAEGIHILSIHLVWSTGFIS